MLPGRSVQKHWKPGATNDRSKTNMTREQAYSIYNDMPHEWQRAVKRLIAKDNLDPGNSDDWGVWAGVYGSQHALFTDYKQTRAWLGYLKAAQAYLMAP
jgi:hypothetical protein